MLMISIMMMMIIILIINNSSIIIMMALLNNSLFMSRFISLTSPLPPGPPLYQHVYNQGSVSLDPHPLPFPFC